MIRHFLKIKVAINEAIMLMNIAINSLFDDAK